MTEKSQKSVLNSVTSTAAEGIFLRDYRFIENTAFIKANVDNHKLHKIRYPARQYGGDEMGVTYHSFGHILNNWSTTVHLYPNYMIYVFA